MRHINDESGSVMALVLFVIITLTILSVTSFYISRTEMEAMTRRLGKHQAFYLAESGIEYARGLALSQIRGGTPPGSVLSGYSSGDITLGNGFFRVRAQNDGTGKIDVVSYGATSDGFADSIGVRLKVTASDTTSIPIYNWVHRP